MDLFKYSALGKVDKVLRFANPRDIDYQNDIGYTSLMIASRNGHVDVVKALLNKGASTSIKNKYGKTAGVWAASNGHTEILNMLINRDLGILAFQATGNNKPDTLRLLLDKGVDINSKNRYGYTLIMVATSTNNIDIFKFLLERGADTRLPNLKGENVIMYAKRKGHVEIVRMLEDLK
jgi:ankyrin repeat protein